MNVPKSQNPLLHVMEAYASLLRVWPNADLERCQIDLLRVMVEVQRELRIDLVRDKR